MPWIIEFFPPSGERDSPRDYITNVSNKSEQTKIWHRLNTITGTNIEDWVHTSWIHKIEGDIFQLRAGPHRLMYCLYEKNIVILHAFYKKTGKTPRQESDRAKIHYGEYLIKKKQEQEDKNRKERKDW